MTKKKQVSIKLDQTTDGVFQRDLWYGYGPFHAKINEADEALSLALPNEDVQVLVPASNEYGKYYVFNIGGGKGFASIINHEKYGTYLRLRLGDKVELPAAVVEKMNYKPKGANSAAPIEAPKSQEFWT